MNRLGDICGNANVLYNEPMKKHTSFRAGGEAKVIAKPQSKEKLVDVIKYLESGNIEYAIVGNGSNLLVSDSGFDGVIILTECIDYIVCENEKITAGCGASLAKIASVALDNSLTGFEFAAGIPGFAGGGVVMNAGAYGGELKDILGKIEYCDSDGDVFCVDAKDAELSYRHSMFSDKKLCILEAEFCLSKGDANEIRERMNELAAKRRDKQPLNYPSAGSAFKRPEGYFAAKLIEDSGLKGFSVGDAQVSDKHCGFIVNKGNASASDIYNLIRHCKKTVLEKQGVVIEPEIKFLGNFE